jgi:hypothetical protein
VGNKNKRLTFGHVLGRSQASRVAFIVTADQAVENLQGIGKISRFLEKHNLTHLPRVEEQTEAAHSYLHGTRLRLTEEESDINIHRRNYVKVLQEAAVDSKTQIVKLLLNHGADINTQGRDYGNAHIQLDQ